MTKRNYEEEIEEETSDGPGQEYRTRSHRSWGYIRLTQVSGGGDAMFMSDTAHMHKVRLSIGPAVMLVNDGGDRSHVTKGVPFAEVELTEADLGRLFSRTSSYSGVPCTVRRVGGEQMPICPDSTRFTEFAQEVKDTAENVTAPLGNLETVLTRMQEIVARPGSIRKGEMRQAVVDALGCIGSCQRTMHDTLPFYMSMLGEHMTQVVEDGKASIDAHADLKARELGIEPGVLRLGGGDAEPG